MQTKSVKWIVLAGALVLGALLYWRFSAQQPLNVSVHRVQAGVIEQTVANTRAGTIKACRRSRLSMPIGGRVADLRVSEGDAVEAGELLLTLWNEDRQALLDQSIATQDAAVKKKDKLCLEAKYDERELERVKRLFAKRLTSEDHLDSASTRSESRSIACQAATAEIKIADANIRVQQSQLEQTRLYAPFAGVVAEINGEIGEYVTPSPPGVPTPPAVDLIDTSCLYVTAPIDEVDAALISVGLEARITLDAFRGRVFPGRVRRIAPYVLDLEKQARTVDVEVEFVDPPEDHLLVGYSADIEAVIETRENVLRIPTESVVDGDQVWIVDGEVAVKRSFERGLSNWNWTEVVSGVDAGQAVITTLEIEGLEEGAVVTPGNG